MITFQIVAFLLYALTVTGLFAVLVPGYLLWLRWGRRKASARDLAVDATAHPRVDVIVPVHNEAEFIERKLENLAALAYPPDDVRMLIIDGASTDGTWEIAARRAATDPRFTLVRSKRAHKTHQLNAGLRRSHGAWVVVSDADAQLAPETLCKVVAVGEADPAVAVVGTIVVPERAHVLESLHWRIANAIRGLESERGSASLVAGPCYAFRRTLFDQFPGDVVSDDIYVALAAAASGRRVVVADVTVTEQRSPITLADLFHHKLRKTDGYLREIFRFLPQVRQMSSPARAIFLWRAAHLTVLPVLVALGALGSVVTLIHTRSPGRVSIVVVALAVLLVGASAWGIARRSHAVLVMVHSVLIAAVTLAALVAYPFSRRTASFAKLASGPVAK